MKHLLIIFSLLLLYSPLFSQSGKPQTIIIPTGSLGEMSEARIKILEKTLESKLDDHFAIVPKEIFEEAKEKAFEELEYNECTEDQCIMKIQELLQVENAFKMELISEEGDTQISLTWNDQNQKRVEEDYCEGCKTKGLRLMIGGLVEKLVGEKRVEVVVEKPIVVVEKRQKGVLFNSKKNGQWQWFKDGDEEKDGKYVGEIENGLPNGQGTQIWKNPFEKYIGEWKNGNRHGQGTLTYPPDHGGIYVGEYKDGKEDGFGTTTWQDPFEKYEGEYKDAKQHGQGTYTWSNGSKYEGEFMDGERTGQGIFTWSDGDKYVGEWKNGKQWNGTMYDKDRNIIGKWVNGVK